MKWLIEIIRDEDNNIIERIPLYMADRIGRVRGKEVVLVEGIKTDYPEILEDVDGNLSVIEDTIKRDLLDYRKKRKYPPIGDQLDFIFKFIKHLKTEGVNIGQDAESYISLIQAEKNKHPKPQQGN